MGTLLVSALPIYDRITVVIIFLSLVTKQRVDLRSLFASTGKSLLNFFTKIKKTLITVQSHDAQFTIYLV